MKKLVASFGFAIKGIFTALKEQQNMRMHLLATAVVIVAGFIFGLSKIEWSIIALTIGLVIVTELLNTAIEMLVDLVSPEYNERAGKIKDVSAGAVLLSAIISVVVAVFIFGNKIF